jgi:P2 family phage contractile tail tube protein
MANDIPEKLINFAVYDDGTDMVGAADVTLPSLEFMTDTVSGAGVAGEFDSPVIGHLKAMELELKWRTVTQNVLKLAAPKSHQLDLRGSIQVFDAGNATYKTVPLKVVVKAIPKKTDLGKLEVGKPQDSGSTFSLTYLKITLAGEEKVEIDIFNYKCVIDGEDYLASVRADLGKEG